MFHVNAWGTAYNAPMVGAKLVFPGPKMADGETLTRLINSEKINYSLGTNQRRTERTQRLVKLWSERDLAHLPAMQRVAREREMANALPPNRRLPFCLLHRLHLGLPLPLLLRLLLLLLLLLLFPVPLLPLTPCDFFLAGVKTSACLAHAQCARCPGGSCGGVLG